MTDNPNIIDGIDISECNFCEWKSSDIPQCRIRLASFEPTCKGYNCHYKQLKHKEQECEELKKKCNIYTCGICGNKENCNKLYKTIAEIKKIVEQISLPMGTGKSCNRVILAK